MKITITSMGEFNELDYDRAYGIAKRLIGSDKNRVVKRVSNVALTAVKSRGSIMVTIHKA